MRRILLPSSALLVLFASLAHAYPGVNLRWSNCFGDGGTTHRTFACDTNTGTHTLVASFEVGQVMPGVNGQEAVVDLLVAGASLPAWWSLRNVGSCRPTSLSANFVVSPTAESCVEWGSPLLGGIASYNVGFRGPSTARIFVAEATENAVELTPGLEYFAFNLVINNAKTVGAGSCAGCSEPACIAFNSIKVMTVNPSDQRTLSGPTNFTDSHFVTWQGTVPVPPGGLPCPWPLPVKRETWGAVKSLYR